MLHEAYFHLPYHQAEGVVIAHAGNKKIPSIPNYSTINRRINNQDIRISERHEVGNDDDDIIMALDSTGIKACLPSLSAVPRHYSVHQIC